VDHCIGSVWHGLDLPQDTDGVCQLCKDVIAEAHRALASGKTERDIEVIFDNACQLIPLPEVEQTCEQIGAQYIPEVLQLLASNMEPQEICAAIMLCNSVDVDRQLHQAQLEDWQRPSTEVVQVVPSYGEPDPGDCDDCKNYLGDMRHLVTKYGKQELQQRLLGICAQLGSVSDGCSALVEVNIDVIYDWIVNEMDIDGLCDLFGMCENVAQVLRAHTGDVECDMCVVVMNYVQSELTANTTETEFREILESLCTQAGSYASECRSLVDTYAVGMYEWLINNFQPKQVCEMLGLCGAGHMSAPLWTTLDVHRGEQPVRMNWAGDDEMHHPNPLEQSGVQVSVMGESGRVRSGETCVLCQFTLHFVQQQLNDEANRQTIEQIVKGVCEYLPKDLAEQCRDYVDAYGDQVIALIEAEIDPSTICPELGLCPGRALAPLAVHLRDVPCVMCEYVMVQLKELLGDHTNQDAVKKALEQVCSLMPGSLEKQCDRLVEENAVEIMELVAMGIKPEQMCKKLGLCTDGVNQVEVLLSANQRPSVSEPLIPANELPPLTAENQLPIARLHLHQSLRTDVEARGQDKTCVVCEFVVNVLEHMVLDNNTHIEEDIRVGLERVCVVLPLTLADDCLTFVERYSDPLVEALVHDLHPDQLCQELTLCRPPSLLGLHRRLRNPVA